MLQPPIRRNIKLAEAPSFGQTIFQYEPTSHGAADYAALAQCVLDGWNPPTDVEVPAPVVETPEAPQPADASGTQDAP